MPANIINNELPQFLRDSLACPPESGQGVHQWLFKLARQLHHHRTPEEIEDLLALAVDGCGRGVPRSEIAEAVSNSRAVAWKPDGMTGRSAGARRPKWPEVNPERIAEIERQDPFALLRLQHESPVTITTQHHDAACLLERLFPGDLLLCVATGHPRTARTLRRSEIKDAGECSHVVPSPMSRREGVNQQGKTSPRTLDNTGPRFYLVTEFDGGDHGKQAGVIRHLASFGPLALVADSGGKSLHAWWHCRGLDERTIRRFFAYAVTLGADPATWARCQLVRMPLGWRPDRGKRQEVLFYDHRNTEAVKGGNYE